MSKTMRGPISPARLALLCAAICALLAAAGCGEKKDKAATQTAARVNKQEITVHQIGFVLAQQRNLKPEQVEPASRQVLERLIDQELALQKADDLKLDRDPKVVQQLEAAKREIIARAYIEKVREAAVKPTAEEIRKYYESKPALFAERRIYNLQELQIEAKGEQVDELRNKLTAAKNINEFVEYLKSAGLRFSANQAVRAAEQLPLQSLDAFAQLKDGQAVFNTAPAGVQILVLAGSRTQPVSEEQARPAIEQFLLEERRRKLAEEDLKALRAAAKITYVGKFADAASAPAGAAPAPMPATPSASLPGSDVSKGIGLK